MLSRVALKRSFSAAAAARSAVPSLSAIEEKISRLPNGMTIASVDLYGVVSQFVIAFRAGSRYEQSDEQGLVHNLRNCIGIDSENFFGLKLLWQSGNIGSNLVSTASKDLFTLRMSVNRTYANIALSILGEFAQSAFKPWDIVDALENVPIDLANQEPLDILLENLHKSAFREGPLGNPLLTPAIKLGKISSKQLSAYAKSRLVTSEAVIVGINVDHSVLLNFATSQGAIAEGSAKAAQPSPYFGGESRTIGNTSLAHVAIAGQGAKLSDVKGVAVQAVLASAIGQGPNQKFADSPGFGVVSSHVFKAANHNPFGVNSLNVIHSDAGLVGTYLVVDGDKAGSCVKAAIAGLKELASSGPDAEVLATAKKLAEVQTNVKANCSASLAVDQAAQILANGQTVSPAEFTKLIRAVSADEVKKAAAQLVSKLSIASFGKVNQVPYLDQL